MLEQMVPFLFGMWAHASMAGDLAAYPGWIYVLSRCIYPWGFWKGSPYILMSTIPGYIVIWYQLLRALYLLVQSETASLDYTR